MRDREFLRFERTRVFARVRRIFVEIGRRLAARELIDVADDVFYLAVDEVLGFIDGTSACSDLRGLVKLRRAEFARYRRLPEPGNRFETRGIVNHGNTFTKSAAPPASPAHERRCGLGCSPGTVRGSARVVRDPRNHASRAGEILVAERTDPGWVVLFPAAAGLVVEKGSLLSHSAIVARELGLPAVVSLPGACDWLRDGDEIEIDGRSGEVRKLGAAAGLA